MKDCLFQGELIRLVAVDPKPASSALTEWVQNSEYQRLLGTAPASLWSLKKLQEWLDKDLEKDQDDNFLFWIQILADGCLAGFISLDGISWAHGDTFISIGIGNRENWSQGFGTDAMKVILRYAFTELNLRRVSLNVFAYNLRALRSYEKAGFVVEGRERRFLLRDGRRWDLVYMGILRQEWLERNT